MQKVLIIATSHKTRGGITSVILSHQKGRHWKEYNCKWVETHIDRGWFWKLFYLIDAFVKYIFILPFYDLIHIHISEPPSAIRKCLFMWWANVWKKKTIIHFHSFSPDTTIKSRNSGIYRYLFTKADVVFVLSKYWKDEVNKIFHLGDKIKIIYNPCSITIYDKQYVKKKSILYAGAINSRKGYADLICAFSKIAINYSDWNLVFAGNGEIENGKLLAINLGIENQVHFLGWVNGEAKDKAFKEASIFCLPSYAEGFPMAVLDAWAYGLPVVSTPVGGLPDIAIDNENILMFNPGDKDKLAEQLERMINEEELRKNISNASIELSKTTFSEKVINYQVEELYKRLLS